MIEVKGLTKSYQNKKVLDAVDLEIRTGEICALVGRNGAGKSTLIHCMLDILPVNKGEIRFNGVPHRSKKWKAFVAYLPEKFQLYPQLTGEENMRFFASLGVGELDLSRINECLHRVHLWDERNQRINEYSKGMLQRLGLGIMLYFDAEILILDEPTSGLDPIGREEILQILQSLQEKTILFSSHHMDEIRRICTHIAYLNHGKITKFPIQEFDLRLAAGGI